MKKPNSGGQIKWTIKGLVVSTGEFYQDTYVEYSEKFLTTPDKYNLPKS